MVHDTENLISKISLGKVSIPKTSNETWDKTYMQSQGVSRQNIWILSARTHTDGHPIVRWETWKSLSISWLTFKPDKFLSQACYASAQLF